MALKTVTRHSALLCMLRLIKRDMDGLKGSSALTVFVCHRSLCFCVGVRVRGGMDVSKSFCGIVAVGIERLASN